MAVYVDNKPAHTLNGTKLYTKITMANGAEHTGVGERE
jgi:hypothetical protein